LMDSWKLLDEFRFRIFCSFSGIIENPFTTMIWSSNFNKFRFPNTKAKLGSYNN
jgi:hypothetical protein